jgi:hypothetical protein
MIDYSSIWESINKESKSNPQAPQIARRIPSKSTVSLFLATDFKKGIRLLYVKLENDHQVVVDNLPRFRGMELSLLITSLGEFKNQEFLKFTQSIPNTDNIFELVISDICDKIVQLQNIKNLNSVLIRSISEWKVFFEKQENKILSISSQKGLVGELHFLKDYLFAKYSLVESLLFWTGPEKSNHDFQVLNNAVEVKTTSGKQHKKFTVSSEKQLDSTGLDHLYLSLFSLNVHSNMPERTLPVLVREIYSWIKDDPIATFQFQLKLIKYGYDDRLADKYLIGFSILEMKFYAVRDGFPRLQQNSLPNGVGDLSYSIVVAACNEFEIKTEIINHF